MNNPIQATSRTFLTILNDINNDPELVDKPDWFKKLIAGLGDTLSIWINSVANLMFLRTAYTRQAVMDLCALIDYTLGVQTGSSGEVWFDVDTSLGTAIFPFMLQIPDLIAMSAGSLSSSSLQFEAPAPVTFVLVTNNFTTNYAVNSNLTVTHDFLYTGAKVRLATSSALPSPLQTGKDYYLIYVNATTVKLALTREQAIAGVNVVLTDNGAGTQEIQLFSQSVNMAQQKTTSTPVNLGQSDGVTPWQEFQLPDLNTLPGTLSIIINSVPWLQVDSWAGYGPTDKVYRFIPNSDGSAFIRFADGNYGAIPSNGIAIMAQYAVGGGAISNINALNSIVSYTGSDSRIKGVSNATAMTGGGDSESLATAAEVAPILLKSRDRFITIADGEALALAYGGVSLVSIIKNAYGVLSCEVVAIASGGGNPSNTLKSNLQAYLIGITILSSIDVRVVDSTITAVNVTAAANLKPGYIWTNVHPYFRLAFKLFLTETGAEILNEYNSNGISAAVSTINSNLTENFGTSDYAVITNMLDNMIARDFGDTLEESAVYSFVQSNVPGINYMTISVFGTELPLALAADEITTVGTLNLTQI